MISYRSDYPPSITLESGEVTTSPYIWRNLPDEGVKLPGGRPVQVACAMGWDILSDTNIPQLKEKVRNHLNREQWNKWAENVRPAIVLPDLGAESPAVPEIITAQYGLCVIEGTPLLAYGTVVAKGYRYYSSDPYFESKWYQYEAEAQTANARAVAKLEEIRAELREKREREAVQAAAQQAKEKIDTLLHNSELDQTLPLRDKLSERRNQYLPAAVAELQQWIADTEAIIAEAEAVVAESSRQKAAEEADTSRAVAAGEILLGFEAWHRRGGMTSNGDGWVIKADGTLRQRDTDDVHRHKSDGNYRWNRIERNELALRWACSSRRDVAGNSTFETVKLPVGGLTNEQLATVRQIEEEIEAPQGAFGLDLAEKKVEPILRDSPPSLNDLAAVWGARLKNNK